MHRINRLRPHLPVLLVALLLAAVLPDGAAGLGCLDFDGAAVDWYIIYKLPGGLAYTYTDAQRANGSLPAAPGRDDLSADDSPLTRTVFSVLSARASSASVIYNDDIPEGSVDERIYRGDGAHAKGILAADAVGALWLIHSEPNYPSMVSSNYWADASTIYAQSFLCLSLDVASANVAALQLQYMQPKIYSHSLPEALKSSYPGFEGLLAGEEPGDVSVAELSVGDARPLSFAKSPDWGFDLYEDLVAPTLDTGLAVETWRRSPFLPTYCPPEYDYVVANVQYIRLAGDPEPIKYTRDHAKWAVSISPAKPYACVGGINRMPSQRKRGGGTVCLSHAELWKALQDAIVEVEYCPPIPTSGGSSSSSSVDTAVVVGIVCGAAALLAAAGVVVFLRHKHRATPIAPFTV